ncbi:MAG: PepSY domain-containing protein [Marinobacter sp.]|uniref:PepSY domain-containing protein n=1 Tax=Marinobacter sp. TaxID=50741 RepID=UPI0029B112FE|nr:PepSY domain-containing protein [Marinobacter sp.]
MKNSHETANYYLRPRLLPVLLALVFAAAAPVPHAVADDDEDWHRLHKEVQAGRIKPLSEILDTLSKDWIGDVIDVELDTEDGRRIYEIELLGPQGQVVEFEVDAATGEIMEMEGRNIRGMRR